MPRCRDCCADIQFIELKKSGGLMPCDTELVCLDEVDEGVRIVTERGVIYHAGMIGGLEYYRSADPSEIFGYCCHFDTCVKG